MSTHSQQADPGDSGSGDGAKSEVAYTVTFTLEAGDTDMYAVDLAAGDVFSAAVSSGAARLQVFDSARQLAIGSTGTGLAALLPKASPVARGGNAALHHIAARRRPRWSRRERWPNPHPPASSH